MNSNNEACCYFVLLNPNNLVGNSGVGKTSLGTTLTVFQYNAELLSVLFRYRTTRKGDTQLPTELADALNGMQESHFLIARKQSVNVAARQTP